MLLSDRENVMFVGTREQGGYGCGMTSPTGEKRKGIWNSRGMSGNAGDLSK